MTTAREIRLTVQFFIEDLQEERYIDAMGSLVELHEYAKRYDYSKRLSAIPDDVWIRENLPEHKHGIMKRILRYIKNYDQEEVNRYVPKMVAALRYFGVDWADLDVVSKSLQSDIKESDMSSSELNDFFNIERNFNSNQIYSALLLIDKNDFTATRHSDIAEILDDQQDNIQEFMQHRLDRKDVFEVIRMFDIVQSTKIGWTWPKQFLEQHKHDVIKLLLIAVVNPYGDPELSLELAWMLKKNGITWPELSIIEKSVRTDIKKHEA
jgi:hypothetical protein